MEFRRISRKDARKILEVALSKGGDFAEIYNEKRSTTMVKFDNGRVEEAGTGVDAGVGIRVVYGEKTSYASGNDISLEALFKMAGRLAESVGRKLPGRVCSFKKSTGTNPSKILIYPSTVPFEEKVALTERADRAAREFSERIIQVTAVYRDTLVLKQVINSLGVYDEDEELQTVFYVVAVARDETGIQTGYKPAGGQIGFELFQKEPVEKIAREAARIAVLQLDAEPAPAGEFTVVLSSSAGGTMIHEACGHGLEGDFIKKGLSVFAGKTGQKVASSLVSVIDDGTLPNMRGSGKIDDEGNPVRRVVLIDRGILKGYLHDMRSARENDVEPTGNGRRQNYRYIPIPRMRNTFIAPGTSTDEEIIRSVDRGILVKNMGGGQVDVVSGQFVFNITEGYLIENGRTGRAIRGATLVGNGPKVLEEIDMVGTEVGYAIGTCGKEGQGVPVSDGQPTIRIPRITVGGIVRENRQ